MPRMPEVLDRRAGSPQFLEHGIREPRPGLFRPAPEALVGEARTSEPGVGIDPEEAAALAEMAERPRRVPVPRPVRPLLVAKLAGEPPVVRLHPAEAGQNADQTRERHLGRFRERL